MNGALATQEYIFVDGLSTRNKIVLSTQGILNSNMHFELDLRCLPTKNLNALW